MQYKISGHHQFTEKHLKALKNISKANYVESTISKEYYQKGYTPVLVSALLARSINCGQVDLCFYKAQRILLIECKFGGPRVSAKQYMRLTKSLGLLTNLFNAQGQILVKSHCQKN